MKFKKIDNNSKWMKTKEKFFFQEHKSLTFQTNKKEIEENKKANFLNKNNIE